MVFNQFFWFYSFTVSNETFPAGGSGWVAGSNGDKDHLSAFHGECACLRLVRAHLCTDLYENLVGGGLLSYKHKFQI